MAIYSSQHIVQLIVKLKSTVKTYSEMFVEMKWFIIIHQLLSFSTTVYPVPFWDQFVSSLKFIMTQYILCVTKTMCKRTYFRLYDALQYTTHAMVHLVGISAITTKISKFDLTMCKFWPTDVDECINSQFCSTKQLHVELIYSLSDWLYDVKNDFVAHRISSIMVSSLWLNVKN